MQNANGTNKLFVLRNKVFTVINAGTKNVIPGDNKKRRSTEETDGDRD